MLRQVVEISYSPLICRDLGQRVSAYSLDVPKPLFDAMMERAARHRGYTPFSEDLHVYRSDNTTLEIRGGSGGARSFKSTLVAEREIQGTPLVERTYMRTNPLPMYMFSCARNATSSLFKVRRLSLRIHKFARIVFEVVSRENDEDIFRRIFIETTKNRESDRDIQRTVENTIQVVILGQQPKRSIFKKKT